ncbi:MAG: ABC transporter permease [Magnetococcus sp. XQGC-1]
MNPLLTIAGKEWQDGVRNRWIVGATVLLAGLAFVLSFLGAAPTGLAGVKPLAVTVVSLASLTIFLIPLIALLLAHDALVGEFERGTMLLLLTYPVTRMHILFGKFLGHAAILACATVLGYGAAGLAVGWGGGGGDVESWRAFGALVGTSILLGMVFIAMAYLISVFSRERGMAAGMAIAVWLVFVMVYDLGLLGILVSGQGRIGVDLFPYLLLGNPADIFRLFNLSAFENVRMFSGLAGLSGGIPFSPVALLGALVGWMVVPLGLAAWRFRKSEP